MPGTQEPLLPQAIRLLNDKAVLRSLRGAGLGHIADYAGQLLAGLAMFEGSAWSGE